jgi:hypothetical protein
MNQLVGKDEHGNSILVLLLEPGNIHKMTKLGMPVDVRIEDFFPEGIPRKLRLTVAFSETPIADSKQLAELAEVALDERSQASVKVRPHCPECRSTIEQLAVWRNESPMALTFCATCGCVFGMVPSEIARTLRS